LIATSAQTITASIGSTAAVVGSQSPGLCAECLMPLAFSTRNQYLCTYRAKRISDDRRLLFHAELIETEPQIVIAMDITRSYSSAAEASAQAQALFPVDSFSYHRTPHLSFNEEGS
jgi:hypothetical protein